MTYNFKGTPTCGLDVQMNIVSVVMIFMGLMHLVFSSSNYVNCRIACRKCQDAEEELELLEVYCSMCKECRDSRRQRMKQSSAATDADDVKHIFVPVPKKTLKVPDKQVTLATEIKPTETTETTTAAATPSIAEAWPEGCPTPPVCDDETTPVLQPLTKPQTTTTTTTTTTEAITCPPISTCKPKTTVACCFPMCSAPCGGLPSKIDIDIHFVTEDGLQTMRHSQAAPAQAGDKQTAQHDGNSLNFNIPVNFDGQFNVHGDGSLAGNRPAVRSGPPNNWNSIDDNVNGHWNGSANNWNKVNHKTSDDYYYVYLGVPRNALASK